MKKVLLNLINTDINISEKIFLNLVKYFSFILLVLFSSCEDFESPYWKTQINLPLLDEQYSFNQIIESKGIVECDDDLVCLEYKDTMFDELGVPSEYFMTSEFALAPTSPLSDLVGEIAIPSISINKTVSVSSEDINGIPEGLCLKVDDYHTDIMDILTDSDPGPISIPTEALNILFNDYEYMTIADRDITLNLNDNFLYPVKIEYTLSSEVSDEINEVFNNSNDSDNSIIENTHINIGENLFFDYTILPDDSQEFACNACNAENPCPGFQIQANSDYSINLDGEININNIYSITGTTKAFSENKQVSFPLTNNIFDILEGDISSDEENELGEPLNRLELQVRNNFEIPLTISLDLLNFINEQDEVLSLDEFTVSENGGIEQKITQFNGRSIEYYSTEMPVEDDPQKSIDKIYMYISMAYPSQQGTFVFENLYNFDIEEVAIKPIKFDRITTVVHDFIIDVPSLSLSSVPYGIEGLEFVNPILKINLNNQIKIDNTLTFYLQSFLEEELVSELGLEIILNIPDDSNISANTEITIEGDKYTVSYGGDFQYENDLENGLNDSITLSQFLENTSDELRVSGKASLNGTGHLEPENKAAISGDFELNVPFTIIVGEYIEPNTYTNINLIPANPTYLSPFDNSTKESIDNSLDETYIGSSIENNSIFVGSVSMIVSTDENYFPINFDDLGNVSGLSDCVIDLPCIINAGSDIFTELLESLRVLNENSGEFEVVETNIGSLDENNIVLIEYTPMSDTNLSPKLIKFISDNDFLLIGRLTTLDLPTPIIDEVGNIETPGYITYEEPMIIDQDQINLINYISEEKDRYISPIIKLDNSHYLNEDDEIQNDGGIVNILTAHYIKIQSYMSFVIKPGDY